MSATDEAITAHDDGDAVSSRPLAGVLRVSGLTLISRVFGLIRDAAMAAAFGNGPVLDAFSVAFRLPNVTRRLFGEAAFSTAFLPVFVQELHEGGRDAGWKLATAILVVTAAAVTTVTLVAEVVVLAWWSVETSPETSLLLGLVAVLFPYQIFLCIAAQAAAVLHAYGRFALPAILPIVGNIVWLAVLAAALRFFESDVVRIYVVSTGVVLAGAVQFALSLPALKWLGFQFRWDWAAARPRVRQVAFAVLPVLAGLSVNELNSLADGFFAWLLTPPADAVSANLARYPLAPGSAAALYLGQRLYQFPLGVFGVALGTVLFPQLARHAAAGRTAALRDDLALGLKLALAIGMPASVGLMLTAGPLVDALFRYGQFDAGDAAQTAAAIAGYSVGVWAYIALLIINRGFYAVGDRMAPLKAGMIATVFNVAISIGMAWPFGATGLAAGTSLAAIVQVGISLMALRHHQLAPRLETVWPTVVKSAAATFAMAAACLALRQLIWSDDLAGRALSLAVPVAGGAGVYLATAKIVSLDEVWLLIPGRR
jgi:putative peptidoglycan lipid II flippase